jgi:hypothetical protein
MLGRNLYVVDKHVNVHLFIIEITKRCNSRDERFGLHISTRLQHDFLHRGHPELGVDHLLILPPLFIPLFAAHRQGKIIWHGKYF